MYKMLKVKPGEVFACRLRKQNLPRAAMPKEVEMPLVKQKDWERWEHNNIDPYGKYCVDVARRVMELLDETPGDFDPRALICDAERDVRAEGIMGFMAGSVAHMVSACHSRGDEFRAAFFLTQAQSPRPDGDADREQ